MALEKERKRTNMQGKSILGVEEKETRARFYSEVQGRWCVVNDGRGPAGGLGGG